METSAKPSEVAATGEVVRGVLNGIEDGSAKVPPISVAAL